MNKILITGGAGFIGSHLTDYLLEKGYQVTVIDNLSNGSADYLRDALNNPRFSYYEGTVLDRVLMEELIKENDIVYHLAAVLGVKNTVDDPLKVIEGNIDGTRVVLEIAYQYSKKVIFASTSEIYGKNPELPYTEESNRILGDPSIHRWCYATAKALDEHMCFAYAKKGLPVTVVRFFNAFGPRQDHSAYGGVIPIFIKKALMNEKLPIHGDGTQLRCFGFIQDIMKGLETAMHQNANNQAFNLGATEKITILELAKKIITLTGSNSEHEFVPYEVAYGEGFEDIPARLPSLDKANKILGYQTKTSLEEGLIKTIKWYETKLLKR
ncbi:NAD-dependent epimerase/dehydratase family protein [Lysinibacillus sp. SGAir0095]|uniref:NAD-dependent epimerase/dehydratase family protein n=1 Tax=Lysinibacillus sp. SGAir0095 TaxID=2070463 RepID=UPI0010CCF49B|nr:NAD-dependent epimerase/dehydratase family protein [Lysinibacillus sp. SGAir0095]QCR34290.1 NAD-dependent dehydratase [Lysinibacillus sp. SGAir0095]